MVKAIEALPDLSQSDLTLYRIDSMKLFLFDYDWLEGFAPGSGARGYTGLLRMAARGAVGWGAFAFPRGEQPLDLVKWAAVYMPLKGLSIPEVFHVIQGNRLCWGTVRGDLVAAALSDLADNIEYPPAHDPFQLEEDECLRQSVSYFSF